MRKILLTAIALTAVASSAAVAADMPVKAPPPVVVAPVSTWTGCYIGGNIGWARAKTEVSFNRVGDFSRSADGFAGGGQVGCDYQFASNWVFGVQAMFDWTDIEASRESRLFTFANINAKVRGFGTITGRLGYAISPAFLLYGKFGWGAYDTRFTVNDRVTGFEYGSANRRQSGFDLGVGGEWMIAPNWSVWVEWDHIFAQNKTFFFPNLGSSTAEVRRDFDKVLVGFNWRFGGVGAAPVTARY